MWPNVAGRQQETMGKHNVTVLDIGQAGQHSITNSIPLYLDRNCFICLLEIHIVLCT